MRRLSHAEYLNGLRRLSAIVDDTTLLPEGALKVPCHAARLIWHRHHDDEFALFHALREAAGDGEIRLIGLEEHAQQVEIVSAWSERDYLEVGRGYALDATDAGTSFRDVLTFRRENPSYRVTLYDYFDLCAAYSDSLSWLAILNNRNHIGLVVALSDVTARAIAADIDSAPQATVEQIAGWLTEKMKREITPAALRSLYPLVEAQRGENPRSR